MATTTTPARSTQRESHGRCRWCGARPTADLLDFGAALLEITPTQADGKPGEAVCYWIARVDGGYTVTRQDGAVYTVDTTFGRAVEHWSCDCRDSEYRPHKICKHRVALYTALRFVGLL